jgi:two-component system chemotaxis response regulator CheB
MTHPVRVLIADDSPLFVDWLVETMRADPALELVGVANNGQEAVTMTGQLHPELIIMDVRMPVMNGLEAIEAIMAQYPTPILVVTAEARGKEDALVFDALQRGALDLLPKPDNWEQSGTCIADLCEHMKLLASIPVVHHLEGTRRQRLARAANIQRWIRPPKTGRTVGIVASTGGPAALAQLLSCLPDRLAASITIVQHLQEGFVDSFVDWLDAVSPIPVELARDREPLQVGTAYVAPNNTHLLVTAAERLRLERSPPLDGFCPSGNRLLSSLAESYRNNAVGVVLTGMGSDGADGLLAIAEAGGTTIIQDGRSAVVDGMPAAARHAVSEAMVLSLEEIAQVLGQLGARTQT